MCLPTLYRMKFAESKHKLWNSIAYMNYIQFMLPHMKTENYDISERDYTAFCETVAHYEPNIIIVWGSPVGNALKEHGQDDVRLPDADINYVFKQQIAERECVFVNCYHPSNLYGRFTNDTDNFARQLRLIL